MKIVRDQQGRIIEIIKGESDGDINVVDVFKAEIEADANKEIAKEKEKTIREEKRENFLKEFLPITANLIIAGVDEYKRQQQIDNYNGLNASEDGY